MKNLITIILTIAATALFGHDVELRFVENRVEGELLFIDIEMRASTYDFNLASHNVRAYYDHSSIELLDVTSQLPEGKYGEPNVDQMFTDGQEVELGLLSFEDHMGFINMSVQLSDNKEGGMDITTSWTTIHTATFKIVNADRKANIVWAMEEVTEGYATAFVEVAEWVSEGQIVAKNAFDLRNFEQEIELNTVVDTDFEVKIGPNPTSNYAIITQSVEGAILSIIDMTGSIVKETSLNAGETVLDVQNFTSGSYVFVIQSGEKSFAEQILITE